VPRRPQKYQETWRVVPGVGTSEWLAAIMQMAGIGDFDLISILIVCFAHYHTRTTMSRASPTYLVFYVVNWDYAVTGRTPILSTINILASTLAIKYVVVEMLFV